MGTDKGFIVGDSLTIADLKLYYILGWFMSGRLEHVRSDIVDAYPKLLKLVGVVANLVK